MRLDSFVYNTEASRAPVAAGKGAKPESTGMERTWIFKGLVKPKAMQLLSTRRSQFLHDSVDAFAAVLDAPDKRQALEDVFWALLNSPEFIFNH